MWTWGLPEFTRYLFVPMSFWLQTLRWNLCRLHDISTLPIENLFFDAAPILSAEHCSIVPTVWQLERMQNKHCRNSKLMSILLAHNIRILKIKLKKKFLRPDFAPLNLLFFQCPFAGSGRGAPLIMPRPFLSGS